MDDWDKFFKENIEKRAQQKKDSINAIKELIRPFTQIKPRPKGYIAVEFDGYGDSGDIQGAKYVASLKHPTEKAPSIQEANYEKITDLCHDLLPGGWEINDGSFGVIKIHFDKDITISVEYNERYSSSEYNEYRY